MKTKDDFSEGPTDEGIEDMDSFSDFLEKKAMETNDETSNEKKEEKRTYSNGVLEREYNVGRNDKCPCGSGKKYKKCCLESGKYERYVFQQEGEQ